MVVMVAVTMILVAFVVFDRCTDGHVEDEAGDEHDVYDGGG